MAFNRIHPPLHSKPLYYSYTIVVVCLAAVASQMEEEMEEEFIHTDSLLHHHESRPYARVKTVSLYFSLCRNVISL